VDILADSSIASNTAIGRKYGGWITGTANFGAIATLRLHLNGPYSGAAGRTALLGGFLSHTTVFWDGVIALLWQHVGTASPPAKKPQNATS